MAQWDVYANPSARLRDELPYLVLIQSDLLDALATRFVIPLARGVPARGLPARLSPRFEVAGESLLLLPQEAGPIDAHALRRSVASLKKEAHRIVDALDAVVSGL
jgi:toxin CcdB